MKCRAISSPSFAARLSFRLCLWLVAMAMPPASVADTGIAVEHLHVEQPRDFGFQLGDQFERRVRLRLRHPYELVLDSLPPPGRLNRWIAFHSWDVEKETTANAVDYEITLRYQVVNVEPTATDAGVPAHQLQIAGGDETLNFQVRPSRTVITPFGEVVSNELAADIAPVTLPGRRKAVAWSGAALVASLLALSALHLGWLGRRTRRPFARAHRLLREYRRDPLSDEQYSAALRTVHEAFNRTAGHTLFPDQLDAFFEQHPGFARIEAAVVAYFARSNAYFFAASSERFTLGEIRAFARQCRDVERGRA